MCTAKALIDCYALKHNLQLLRKLAPISKLIAIVKANAYGHGLLKTAQTLKDADAFGVASLEEALHLRAGGIMQPILLLEGFHDFNDLPIIVKQDLHIVVYNEEQLHALEIAKLSKPITVWMKLDIGMHRLGVRLEQADLFYHRLYQCSNIYKPVNIISHFSHANKLEYKITEQQLSIFNSFCIGKKGMRSIAASSGILLWSHSHLDYIRPGIILYGISPFEKEPWGFNFGFRPVMSLTSNLIAIREHKAGESVSYGGVWISQRDTRLGIIAIGYGDGYPRIPFTGIPVLINNREVPIVGNVAMDMTCVDLGPLATDKMGDTVILWGKNLPVERIAKITGLSNYELVTCLTSRVKINFYND